jgi:hypothetical protein
MTPIPETDNIAVEDPLLIQTQEPTGEVIHAVKLPPVVIECQRYIAALRELAETSWVDIADGTEPDLKAYRAWVKRTAERALKGAAP